MYDDNTTPTLALLWAARRKKGPDIQYNHVYGDPRNPATYTALWNLCVTPAFLAKTTDGPNHPEVLAAVRYRAVDLYGCWPAGEERPAEPSGYRDLAWAPSPEPVPDLEWSCGPGSSRRWPARRHGPPGSSGGCSATGSRTRR